MFTGLIEDVGTLRAIRRSVDGVRLTISTKISMEELQLGESVAVNGVCLTVVSFGGGGFSADVSLETVDRTNLSELQGGGEVNLERALRLSDRLGGHLVTGHVDGIGVIRSRTRDGNAERFVISMPEGFHRHFVAKGSVAIDGVSLTVNSLSQDEFSLAIIPHSLAKTTLKNKQVGARVNIETDIIGKYVERLLGGGSGAIKGGSMDFEFLAKHGFM